MSSALHTCEMVKAFSSKPSRFQRSDLTFELIQLASHAKFVNSNHVQSCMQSVFGTVWHKYKFIWIHDSCLQIDTLKNEALAERFFDVGQDKELETRDGEKFSLQVSGLLGKVSRRIDRSSKYRCLRENTSSHVRRQLRMFSDRIRLAPLSQNLADHCV